ncbi:bifunctional glutamate N-acetyltransferase/amino-acid acetyltransferase ArgJ [Paenibacillus aquistagni]|uniref:Arginine biosynthesis bifunctional protein ArgJ n=1 Tax=Paenibacillus aquistagni TaxID=1852522 RepID=A0A1X7KY41_9BACL|nr:bifunctional glutamate N-acetyltransferase/amino-acid acetyltransferase ArgJ [Paenibacillus aquistagni]SMG46385.1 glutamate N-acetyltransferase [Paenibacillus aquistagni]
MSTKVEAEQASVASSAQDLFTIIDGSVTTPKGYQASGLHCGLKKTERNDIGAIVSDVPATAAAVYTTNAFQAAPLGVTRESLSVSKQLQAVIVNSGNANACTGKLGEQNAYRMREAFAQQLDVDAHLVAVASTGVIGEQLKMDCVEAGVAALPEKLSAEREGAEQFSQAILTTDLVKKEACVLVNVNGVQVTIAGAAKGSGMIHPNMATMLAFVTTDAAVEPTALEQLLKKTTNQTFNMITVDGDTSTNDMLLVMANGTAQPEVLHEGHEAWHAFEAGFRYVCEVLAQAIARDGEGATKLIEVQVQGASSHESASKIAKSVVGSSLVKSAVFGADANWGRVIAAVGYAGEAVEPDKVDIHLGPIVVLEQSTPVAFDEEEALEYLRNDKIVFTIQLHMGEGEAVAWGCDLTYDYVRINAAYRT